MSPSPEIMRRMQNVFRQVFDRADLCVSSETTARDVSGWDSLAHVSLIVALEREFGVRLRAALMARMQNVGDMAAHIEGRL